MASLTPDDLNTALRWRYATSKFDPARQIPADVWTQFEQSLVLAPSSFGLQPWRFVVVTDPAVRAGLLPHAYNQRQVVDASHLLVFAAAETLDEPSIDRYIARVAAVRGQTTESLAGYRATIAKFAARKTPAEQHAWAAAQVYIAFGQAILAAALLGLDACPMEGFDKAKTNTALGLDGSGYRVVVLLPVGYRLETDKYAALPKVRFPAEAVIQHLG